jgi:hypothetical protein
MPYHYDATCTAVGAPSNGKAAVSLHLDTGDTVTFTTKDYKDYHVGNVYVVTIRNP